MTLTSVLSAVAKPFKFVGKAFMEVEVWVPKILGIAAFSEAEAKIVVPSFTKIFNDTESLAKMIGDDAKKEWPALLTLVSAIEGLSGAGALNPADYAKVITSVSTFITEMHGLDYGAVFTAVKAIVDDYDDLGSDVKTAIEKFEAIVKQ